ncbi:MAG: NADH-quinone oxidoreductase subunit L, partial [Verrucomicrobiae bacterium]|nr:NADH-quinone oxidoreductase subunit L [Verrucomicrobiae bacterium]
MGLWLIQILPLASAAIVLLFLRRQPLLAIAVSVGSAFASFGLAAAAFLKGPEWLGPVGRYAWLEEGPFSLTFGLQWDSLSKLMILIVTGVGALIHFYSIGYMAEDSGKGRYFGYLSLFMFSMTGIVLSDNFIQLFVFWELVGLSSYLLIGFWYERHAAAQAGKKAFLVNRIGDFGFLLGILAFWMMGHTFSFSELASHGPWTPWKAGSLEIGIDIASLLVFCGAVGKSAQVPLHVWLPDAMEGPTPVSALIHAATMVAAGIYMLSRVYFLVSASALAMTVITWVGIITALFAALWGTQQNDIKRVLAYSTLSQLGLMVMALGLPTAQGYGPAMFHLSTHAFFKALLFLAAGNLITVLHHEQDIWKMGGLWGRASGTFAVFLIGALALMGVPGLSGFYSKESILAAAFHQNRYLFAAAWVTTMLTALYTTRLLIVVFFGKPRSDEAAHARDPGFVMLIPVFILAILSVFGSLPQLGIRDLLPPIPEEESRMVTGLSIFAIVLGAGLAGLVYGGARQEPVGFVPLQKKFYFDEAYGALVRLQEGVLSYVLPAIEWIWRT